MRAQFAILEAMIAFTVVFSVMVATDRLTNSYVMHAEIDYKGLRFYAATYDFFNQIEQDKFVRECIAQESLGNSYCLVPIERQYARIYDLNIFSVEINQINQSKDWMYSRCFPFSLIENVTSICVYGS